MYSIYSLVDPRDRLVRYVGMTTNPLTRFIAHIMRDQRQPAKYAWVQGLIRDNLLPEMHILAKVKTRGHALDLELEWIKHFCRIDMPLTNTSGMDWHKPQTFDQKAAIYREQKRQGLDVLSPLFYFPSEPDIPEHAAVVSNMPVSKAMRYIKQNRSSKRASR